MRFIHYMHFCICMCGLDDVYKYMYAYVCCAALMYSIFGVGASKLRGAEDELNTLGAATLTGLLYRIPINAMKPAGAKPGL